MTHLFVSMQNAAHVMGFPSVNISSHMATPVPFAKEIHFVVPFSIEHLESETTDISEPMRLACVYVPEQNDNTLEIHSFELTAVTPNMTRIAMFVSTGKTAERKRLVDFIYELNALQRKYNISINPTSPMLDLNTGYAGSGYDIMSEDDNNVLISRVWGG